MYREVAPGETGLAGGQQDQPSVSPGKNTSRTTVDPFVPQRMGTRWYLFLSSGHVSYFVHLEGTNIHLNRFHEKDGTSTHVFHLPVSDPGTSVT